MSTLEQVWIYAESDSTRSRLCAGAQNIAESVSLIFVGGTDELDSVEACGADEILYLGREEDQHAGDFAETLSNAIDSRKPGLVLMEKSQNGRLLAGKIAAHLGICALSNVSALRTEPELEIDQMIFCGTAIRTVRLSQRTCIALVAPQLFPVERINSEASVEELKFIEPKNSVSRISVHEQEASKVDLQNAKRIVCVGRGVSDEADMEMIRRLADMIGAEIACTRPVSEVYGFLETERYVGVTGVMFQPEVLISVGISGQIQHMVGCNQSRYIMAINKDESARIFPQSDFGIVADYRQVLPKIIELLEVQ